MIIVDAIAVIKTDDSYNVKLKIKPLSEEEDHIDKKELNLLLEAIIHKFPLALHITKLNEDINSYENT